MAEENEIESQLRTFVRTKTADPAAEVGAIRSLPGHAGQSYSFELDANGKREKLVLRVAPAGVRISGTSDVARQARVMRSLEGTGVPTPPIRWLEDDPHWFGRPYFVAEFVTAHKLALGDHEFKPEEQPKLGSLTMKMLATLHSLPWEPRREVWGEPVSLTAEMARLDTLLDRPTLDPVIIASTPKLKERLLATLPPNPRIGCVHGDLNWTNCMYADGELKAVIDWELSQIGAVLIDLGWICLFSDRATWVVKDLIPPYVQQPEELAAIYREYAQWPIADADVRWFCAFAHYRFGVITAFNVMLHRRGKRHDPMWEDIALTGPRFFERGLELLG